MRNQWRDRGPYSILTHRTPQKYTVQFKHTRGFTLPKKGRSTDIRLYQHNTNKNTSAY